MITVAIRPLFTIGQTVATPGALKALEQAQVGVWSLLQRHLIGDWGDVDAADWATNNAAVEQDLRILSAYTLPTGERIWIITEANRSVTTFLLPEEY